MQVKKRLRLTKKEIFHIGRQCASQTPEKAQEYLSVFDNKPIERDHTLIPVFFNAFCLHNGVEPRVYQGPIYKGSKSDCRKSYIAAMVRIFCPHLYSSASGSIRLDYGFIQALATTLNLTKPSITKVVREVVVQEKLYPEFQIAVDELTNKLKRS
jgi:hypothetical protein